MPNRGDPPPWKALPSSGEPLRARTLAEALLYLRVRGAAILGARRYEERGLQQVEVRALHDGEEKRFTFVLSHLDAGDHLHLGGGAASVLLDPADLVLFASRVERELRASLDGISAPVLNRHLRDLELAAEAADEALKFIRRRSDEVPRSAMTTAAARWLWDQDPERFSREQLIALGDRLRRRTIWYQEVLRRLEG